MNSDENKFYIKIVALDEIYNFVVNFFYLKLFRAPQNIVVSAQILKFKI
jgi:hypothetical protein